MYGCTHMFCESAEHLRAFLYMFPSIAITKHVYDMVRLVTHHLVDVSSTHSGHLVNILFLHRVSSNGDPI